jgi:hypothetical protein
LITSTHLFRTSLTVPVNEIWNRDARGLTRTINPNALLLLEDRIRLPQGKDYIGSLPAEFEAISRAQTEGVPNRFWDYQPAALIDYQGRAHDAILRWHLP